MSKGQVEGWLRCFVHPLVVGGWGMPSTLLLLQALQKWQLGFPLVSFYLVSKIYLNSCMSAGIFNLINFLCILLPKERCVQVQALQHCS